MSEPSRREATYEDLYSIPENMTGEIINGELHVTPRPSRRHVLSTSYLGYAIGPAFRRRGGGGWVILIEPEIKLGGHILAPDLAGWKEERYPDDEPHNWISVPPDWVCETLSPGTRRLDRMEKMPLYAAHGIPYLWLVDPLAKTLEVFRSKEGEWLVAGFYEGSDKVRAAPFEEVEIDLSDLWGEEI